MNEALQVWICFELDGLDAPIPRAVKTAGRALEWRNEDLRNRFIVPFTLDYERKPTMRQARIWSKADD